MVGRRSPSKGIRLEDLAALAGVSAATVSRALNDSHLVRDETKRQIFALAVEHKYQFTKAMPKMLSEATRSIVLAIPTPVGRRDSLTDPFFMELVGSISLAARQADCDVIISHVTPQNFDDLSTLLTTNRAEGVIFLGQSFLHERFNRLADTHRRFVVFGGQLPGQRYCSVGSDNHKGGERATSHLLRLGRRRIAFMGDTEAPEISQRYKGYLAAHRAVGIDVDARLVLRVDFDVESAEAAVNGLLARGVEFDGVFGANDLIALGSIRALLKSGRRVPDDISVVGYDDVTLARYSNPALSTISQDLNKAGRLIVQKLVTANGVDALLSERMPTELIVRESCGA